MWATVGCCTGVLALAACTATSTKVAGKEGSGGESGTDAGGSAVGGSAVGGNSSGSAGTLGSGGLGAASATGGASSGSGGASGNGAAMGSGGDAGGGTSGTGSGGTGACSDPMANTRCDGDNLHYETSCGELGELIEVCCGGCGVRQCGPPRLCIDGDLYASDDCVEPTEKLVECSAGTCNKNVCECRFEDANLESTVRRELNVPSGLLTNLETVAMGSLALQSEIGVVSSLSGIECLYELRILSLIGEHQLTDLSPLLALPDLQDLAVRQSTLAPAVLAPIADMTSLELISIRETNITSLPSLEKLSALSYVSVLDSALSDISGIVAAPNLQGLLAGNNNITDLTPLFGKSSLLLLDLSGNPITDLSPLLDLPPLDDLNITNTSVDCTAQATVIAELRAKHTVTDDC